MKRCRRPSGPLHTVWYTSASQLPDLWDSILPEVHFLRKENLRVQESAGLANVTPLYALLQNAEQPIAIAAFQILRIQANHIKAASLAPWQFNSWKTFTSIAHPKLLIGGQLFRHDVASLYWLEEVKPYDVFVWYQETIREAVRKTGAMAVLLKEPPEALVPHILHHAPQYLLLRNDISMSLPIPPEWQQIKDYEQALKHKYAQRFRKLRQSWEKLRIEELDHDGLAKHADLIYKLYLQVTENQSVRMGFLSRDFLLSLKQAHPHTLKVWAVWEGDTMVAFASGWLNHDSFDMFYIGFDYERNSELNLYFNILFFAVEQAISFRKPNLILGRTALEAKARVGCTPQYLNTFLYIRNPVIRTLVSRLQASLSEGGSEWEQRHPFKIQK